MSSFQHWLSKTFKPCCLVLCSDKAKSILAENNLTPAEFLRPLGDFRSKKVNIQFNEKDKELISLNDFFFDFYDNEQYMQISQDQVINYIEEMFKQNEPSWNLNNPLVTKHSLESVKNNIIPGEYCTPWFREFEKTIIECLHFDEYELFQQPLISVYIVSIGESIAVINDDLTKRTPNIITSKRYDHSPENIIITLNDCKDKFLTKEELDKCKSRFAIFKSYYMMHWDINCPPFADKDEHEQKKINDNFKKYIHKIDIYNPSNEKYKNYKNKQYGKYINVKHYNKYRDEFYHYFKDVYIPKLIEKIIKPFYDIIKSKTSIKNIFKKDPISYYSCSTTYKFSQLERAYYNLGMIYFYFHNYDSANENLKLLRNSLKDKSDKHKERAKLLKGMCKFLQKKVTKKEFNYLEELKLNGDLNPHQLIRTELIIIKMLESKLETRGDMSDINKIINYFIIFNSKKYQKENKEVIMEYFKALLEEKLGVYNLMENKFRKYVFYMAISGKMFFDLEKKNYALYCLSKFLYFIDNPSPSFQKLRMQYNTLLGEICNSVKYDEGSFKFYKNCFEFISLNPETPQAIQNKFLQYYVSIVTQIKDKKVLNSNIDLTDLNIPQVDNASLFILEKDDYDIKEISEKIKNSKEKNWLVFNKYAESITTDVYASLDEIDLNHIKLIHDLTNETDKKITNVHTDRYFQGNINQKLFVKCAIRNPLAINIQISSLKLYCTFIPNKASSKNLNTATSIKKISETKDVINKEKEDNNIKEQEKEKNNEKDINIKEDKKSDNINEVKDLNDENKENKNEENNKNNNVTNNGEEKKDGEENKIKEYIEKKKEENNNKNNNINEIQDKIENENNTINKDKELKEINMDNKNIQENNMTNSEEEQIKKESNDKDIDTIKKEVNEDDFTNKKENENSEIKEKEVIDKTNINEDKKQVEIPKDNKEEIKEEQKEENKEKIKEENAEEIKQNNLNSENIDKVNDNKNSEEKFLDDFEIITKNEEIIKETPKDELNQENINHEENEQKQKDKLKNEEKQEDNKNEIIEENNENQKINNNTEQNKEVSNISEIKDQLLKDNTTKKDKDKDIKESNEISRPSLESNFKIDSHTESNQNEYNNNETSTTPYTPTGDQTQNINNNELISNENQNNQNVLSCSVCEKTLKPGETVELELNVSSSQEGKIIVKGLEFSLFSQCNIIHLFSKKITPSLYYYRNSKKKFFTMGGASHISSSSSSDYESRNSSELAAKNLILNNIIIPRKNKIEYIVVDYKNDLYVSFPLGTKINTYLYEMVFFPILIKNNSPKFRVRRYTIFIEESDKNKVKSFLNYITRDNKIKPRGSQDLIFIPLVPLSTGKVYLKILIKYISDLRQSPIQVKRFLIKIKVKDSISFELKEYCSNLKGDKEGITYNKIAFNIKTNLRIRNEKEIKDLKIKEPFFSKDLVLINQKNYLVNSNEIHKKYVFDKENNNSKNQAINNNENKYNFDIMQKIIKTSLERNSDNNNDNKEYDISYVINKFNKILNNSNSNAIYFPWEAKFIKKEENKNNEDSTKQTEKEEEVTLYGLYPYKLKMKNSETSKTFLSFLFNKFANLQITTKKLDKEKTLIKMILKLDKIGLASMGDKFERYEIFATGTQKSIIWLGPKYYIVKNNLEENVFTCRFNYITTLKGNIEVNRISVLVYKKQEKAKDECSVIKINHITKPLSIYLD